ncbi:MAG: prepilin-type N-terminal cleavage/methylation domain-containing protein [Chthoniobacter sp.]|uniref:type IV pilus modification PilV family protein n=1 Tax=Chthoniobacter sp. TaxID=2510640 RepID=UPI0032A90371
MFTNSHRQAFTLIEVSFAVAVFSLFAVSSIYALTLANQFASTSRYETLALAAAQQKIDQIMTTPWSVGSTAPAVLAANSTPVTTTENNLPLNNDALNAGTGLSSAFTSYDTQVLDSRTTTITKLTDCSGNSGTSSRLLRADVVVAFTYRGKPHTVTLNTLRGTDDF